MNEQLYLMALGLSYDEKFEKSILTIQEYERKALELSPDGYYVCDSYGKDSTVLVHLFQLAGVKFKAHHSLTTIDPPELIHFGRKHHADTVVHRPAVPMLTRLAAQHNGPPTRLTRWCCMEYKETGGHGLFKAIGVRASESPRRAAMWRTFKENRTGGLILCPVLYWTDEDIWRHIKDNKLPYCELYDQGFKRLGCVGCPMADRNAAFARWPGYEKAWKKAFQKWFDKWGNAPRLDGGQRWNQRMGIKTWEEAWTWWMEDGLNTDETESCQGVLF